MRNIIRSLIRIQILNGNAGTDYHLTSVIDPTRKLFLMFGNGAGVENRHFRQRSELSFCTPSAPLAAAFIDASVIPEWRSTQAQSLVVGWAGGNTVYLYNPTTDSCSTVTYPNGPGAQQSNGTYKRFSYFPSLNVFAVGQRRTTQNAYALRLTSGGGSGGGTGPVISAVSREFHHNEQRDHRLDDGCCLYDAGGVRHDHGLWHADHSQLDHGHRPFPGTFGTGVEYPLSLPRTFEELRWRRVDQRRFRFCHE